MNIYIFISILFSIYRWLRLLLVLFVLAIDTINHSRNLLEGSEDNYRAKPSLSSLSEKERSRLGIGSALLLAWTWIRLYSSSLFLREPPSLLFLPFLQWLSNLPPVHDAAIQRSHCRPCSQIYRELRQRTGHQKSRMDQFSTWGSRFQAAPTKSKDRLQREICRRPARGVIRDWLRRSIDDSDG